MDVNPTRLGVTRERLRRAGAAAWSTRRDGTTWLALGSLVAGLAAYGFQVVGGRTLGTEAFAPIATLWTVQYLVIAIVLFTIEQYEVRAVAAAGGDASVLHRVWPVLWSVVVVVAAGVAVTLAAVDDHVLLGYWDLALVGGVWVIAMGALAMARGIAGGRGAYRVAGVATGTDSLTRFLLALPALVLFGTTRSLAWVMPLGSIPFLVWWWLRGRKASADVAAVGATGTRAGRFLAATAFANGTLQLLLGAGPLVVPLLGASPSEVSAFFVTTTLARAPLLIGIGLLPRVLTPLTRRAEAGDYAHVRGLAWAVVVVALCLAALAGLLADLLGPEVVGALYGDEFAVSGVATGAAVAAVVVALGALGLNQVLLAENRPQRLMPAWGAGLTVAVLAVLVLPVDPLPRVALAVLAGQTVAIGALALAITAVNSEQPVAAD